MKVQDAIEVMSERKRFHVIVFALLALNFMFIPIHIFVDLFLSYEPKHYCSYPQGGSKYQWIPYNHETHAFESCAIYEQPLTEKLEKVEKKRIEEEAFREDVKVWDWKALKFKSKHYHKYDSHSDHDADDHDDITASQGHGAHEAPAHDDPDASTAEHRRRRRREQDQPPVSGPEPGSEARGAGTEDVTEDGRAVGPASSPPPTDASGTADVATEASMDTAEAPTPRSEEAPTDDEDSPAEEHVTAATSSANDLSSADIETAPESEEDHLEDVDDDDTEEDDERVHPEEQVIKSLPGSDGEVPPIGAGPTGSLAPEYEASDDGEMLEHVTQAPDPGNPDVSDDDHDNSDGDRDDDERDDSYASAPSVDSGDDAGRGYDSGDGGSRGVPGDRPGDRGADSADRGDAGHGGDRAKDRHDGGRKKTSKDHKKDKGTAYGHHGHSKHPPRIPCNHGIHYVTDVGTTLITEHGLSCSRDVSVITNTVVGIAMVAGAIIFAPFVDKYGRKTLFMMVCCQNCLISLGIAFVGDIHSYWVLRFLSRFYIEGVEIALLVLAVEMAPSKSRPIAPLILYVAYAAGQILLSLQAMLFRSWWKLQLAVSVESILLIPFSWFLMPESVQWLVSMRRHQEAEKLIRLGCRLNGIILPSDFKLDKAEHENGEGSDDEAAGNGHAQGPRKSAVERLRSTQLNLKNRPGTGEYLQHEFHAHIGEWRKILGLMKNHQLRRHFFIVSYMWAIVGFLYYGLTASTMVMKGNVYLNYCLSGLVMVPASVSIFILRRFGRKKPIFYFLIGGGIFIILSVVCPYKTPDGVDLYPVYLAIKLLAKYCVVSCLISIRLLIIELFPTPVRGTLIGLTALIGLLGSALGYYFLELTNFSKWVGVAVGALTILAAILSRMLPETSHRPLPDTINDMMAACREMFLNLLVAMPNVPRPQPAAATPQPRPKRNLSALSAFSAVLSWRSRSKSGAASAPARSMSDEDFKRPPHPPLSSMASSPLPRAGEAPALRSVAQRAVQQPRPSFRERVSRALSQRRPDTLEVAPRMGRRTSSTPSLATAVGRGGIDNPQYQQEQPRVAFDLLGADSEVPEVDEGNPEGGQGQTDAGGDGPAGNVQATTHF